MCCLWQDHWAIEWLSDIHKGRNLELGEMASFREVMGKGVKVEPRLLSLLPSQKAAVQCANSFLEQATWTHLSSWS